MTSSEIFVGPLITTLSAWSSGNKNVVKAIVLSLRVLWMNLKLSGKFVWTWTEPSVETLVVITFMELIWFLSIIGVILR